MTISSQPAQDAGLMTWALWYAAQNWPIFPCRGKVPAIPASEGGQGFKDATCDAAVIERWWKRWPQANIGIPTGGKFWVLDCDPRHGGDATLDALERQHGTCGDTASVVTGGGGSHHYFALPGTGTVVHHTPVLGAGLDVQGLGGYVIAPPSVHPETGRAYAWDLGRDLEAPGVCVAPSWLEALVITPAASAQAPQAILDANLPIPEGQRDNTLFRMAASMRHAGFAQDEILAALRLVNGRCEPPLPAGDVTRIVRSSGRVAPDAVLLAGQGARQHVDPPKPDALLDAVAILNTDYPIPQWIIKGLIPEGLTFFAGSPKSSKTYLAYSLALTLALQSARDELWLGHYPVRMSGPVVYVSLEDDAADTKQRILELYPKGLPQLPEGRLIFHHGINVPQLGNGLVQWLEESIIPAYKPAMIVLDPISYLYPSSKKNGDQFAEVREMLLPLRTMGRQHHIGIIGVDHRRKKSNDDIDVFETLYGSNAKIAIADSLMLIVRDDKEITIHCKLRRGADQTLTLGFSFDTQGAAHWEFRGSSDGLVTQGQYGDLRQRMCTLLSTQPKPWTILDMLMELQIPDSKATRNNLYQILFRLQKSGEVQKTTRGLYVWMDA